MPLYVATTIFRTLTCWEKKSAGRLNSKLRGEKIPQTITVMRERTIKSFGVYSYLGGWVAITGYINIMCTMISSIRLTWYTLSP